MDGINIIEKINDNREVTRQSHNIGEFSVLNSTSFLVQCMVEISSSPFINIPCNSIGRIIFGHTRFDKNS